MTLFDWLASPAGVDLVHAVVIVLIAAAGYLTYLTHRQAAKNEQLLDSHLEQHVMDAAARESESTQNVVQPKDAPHNI